RAGARGATPTSCRAATSCDGMWPTDGTTSCTRQLEPPMPRTTTLMFAIALLGACEQRQNLGTMGMRPDAGASDSGSGDAGSPPAPLQACSTGPLCWVTPSP